MTYTPTPQPTASVQAAAAARSPPAGRWRARSPRAAPTARPATAARASTLGTATRTGGTGRRPASAAPARRAAAWSGSGAGRPGPCHIAGVVELVGRQVRPQRQRLHATQREEGEDGAGHA